MAKDIEGKTTEYSRNFSPVAKLLRNPDSLRLMAQNYWGEKLGIPQGLTTERLTELATQLFTVIGTHNPVLEMSATRDKKPNRETGEREDSFIGGISFFRGVRDFCASLEDFGDDLDGWILERSRIEFRSAKKEGERSVRYTQYSLGWELEDALDRPLILICCGLETARKLLGPCMVPPRNPEPMPNALVSLESRLDALVSLLSRYGGDLAGEKDPARRRGGRALQMLESRARKHLKSLCTECMKISDEAERKKKWNSHFEIFCQRCIARVSVKADAAPERRRRGPVPTER